MPALPPITKRQIDILWMLYDHRFLSRRHIQQLLEHADPRNTNRWLADLRSKHYIDWIYSTKFGDNTKPAVLYLTANGIRFFKAQPQATKTIVARLYADKARSQDFIDRCLLVADIALELKSTDEPGQQYELATPSALASPASRAHFLADHNISPDALLVRAQSGRYDALLLQLVTPGMPPHRLHGMLNRYLDLYYSGDWEAQMRLDFPHVVVACKSMKQLRSAKRYLDAKLKALPDTGDFNLTFAPQYRIRQAGILEIFAVDQEKTARH